MLGIFIDISREDANLVKFGEKYGTVYLKTLVNSVVPVAMGPVGGWRVAGGG
jgi:hypothetical protein